MFVIVIMTFRNIATIWNIEYIWVVCFPQKLVIPLFMKRSDENIYIYDIVLNSKAILYLSNN